MLIVIFMNQVMIIYFHVPLLICIPWPSGKDPPLDAWGSRDPHPGGGVYRGGDHPPPELPPGEHHGVQREEGGGNVPTVG